MRLVSLVPSLTETVAALGLAEYLVGVTDYCSRGAPGGARRVGGTKNPSVETVGGLRPNLVLANAEENRGADLDALRAGGLAVLVTYPQTVEAVETMLAEVAAALGTVAAPLIECLRQARVEALAARPDPPIRAVTLVWRKPWFGAGRATYVSDLLETCGFANQLAVVEPWPRLRSGLPVPEVVVLPSEPYAFGESDLPAVHELFGGPVKTCFVDGELLTWHGPRTATALDSFSRLARSCR